LNSYAKIRNHRKTLQKRKKQKSTVAKIILIPKYKLGRGPIFTFSLAVGGAVRATGTRQLWHWSGAFQTWPATSCLDRVTRRNRCDSSNAGRSQRALNVSTQ